MTIMQSLKQTIMERDSLTSEEADELIAAAQARFKKGENPQDVLQEEFDLEPDYTMDLIGDIYYPQKGE